MFVGYVRYGSDKLDMYGATVFVRLAQNVLLCVLLPLGALGMLHRERDSELVRNNLLEQARLQYYQKRLYLSF